MKVIILTFYLYMLQIPVINSQSPVQVCEVLENLEKYKDKVIAVRGTFGLQGDCKPPQGPTDPRYPAPGEQVVNSIWGEFPPNAGFMEAFSEALRQYNLYSKQGYEPVATFVGRLEVKEFGRRGFGHLGDFPARLLVTHITSVVRGKKKPIQDPVER